MLRRLFALLILCLLVGLGTMLWWHRGDPAEAELPEMLENAALQGAVEVALRLNRRLGPYPIEASSRGGVVTLRGRVPGEAERERAEAVAAAVPRVERVENQLELDPELTPPPEVSRSLGEALDDRALAMRVELAFALNRRLEGADLQVSVYRGELTLSGEVSDSSQRDLALALARDVPGVALVTDRVRVDGETADASRTQRVERALRSSPNLQGYTLVVVDDGGRIILSGRVRTGAERELAGALAAAAVPGTAVANELELGH